MEQQGLLIGFAQLALVLTGFISVFIVFIISDGEKSRVNTHHATSMIIGSLISVIGALIPVVLYNYGLSGGTLWWWSSVGMCIFGMLNFLIMGSLTIQLKADELKEAGYIHTGLSYLIGTVAMALILLNVFNNAIPGNYLLGVFLTFSVSVIGFVTFAVQKILYW